FLVVIGNDCDTRRTFRLEHSEIVPGEPEKPVLEVGGREDRTDARRQRSLVRADRRLYIGRRFLQILPGLPPLRCLSEAMNEPVVTRSRWAESHRAAVGLTFNRRLPYRRNRLGPQPTVRCRWRSWRRIGAWILEGLTISVL